MEWINYSSSILIWLVPMLLFGLMIYRYRLSNESRTEKILKIEIGEENSIGGREEQEDEGGLAERDWGILAVIADGIIKGKAGNHAAQITVRTFLRLFTKEDVTQNVAYFFKQAFIQSNREILERLQGAKGGTAAAAAMISHGLLHYASVGDVKITLMRDRQLIPVNDGHTMKTAAKRGYNRGILDRDQALAISKLDKQANFVGRDGFKNIEVGLEAIPLKQGDVIFLMTDGLYKCLSWVEIEAIAREPMHPQQVADKIIEAFNKKTMANKDNASLFVLRYNGA